MSQTRTQDPNYKKDLFQIIKDKSLSQKEIIIQLKTFVTIENQAETTLFQNHTCTPIGLASELGLWGVVDYLLSIIYKNKEKNINDKFGLSAVILNAINKRLTNGSWIYERYDLIAKAFKCNGIDRAVFTDNSNTFHLILKRIFFRRQSLWHHVFELLLKNINLDVFNPFNSQNQDGKLPLHLLAESRCIYDGHRNCTGCLSSLNAKIMKDISQYTTLTQLNTKDNNGNTPVALAAKKNNKVMVKLLNDRHAFLKRNEAKKMSFLLFNLAGSFLRELPSDAVNIIFNFLICDDRNFFNEMTSDFFSKSQNYHQNRFIHRTQFAMEDYDKNSYSSSKDSKQLRLEIKKTMSIQENNPENKKAQLTQAIQKFLNKKRDFEKFKQKECQAVISLSKFSVIVKINQNESSEEKTASLINSNSSPSASINMASSTSSTTANTTTTTTTATMSITAWTSSSQVMDDDKDELEDADFEVIGDQSKGYVERPTLSRRFRVNI